MITLQIKSARNMVQYPVCQEIMHFLNQKGLTLAVAESVTGGKLADRFVSIPGASKVFDSAFITYSSESKRNILGVTADDVYTYDCAEQMTNGVYQLRPNVNVVVSTTGHASWEKEGLNGMWYHMCLRTKMCETVSLQRYIPRNSEDQDKPRNEVREMYTDEVILTLRDFLYSRSNLLDLIEKHTC